MLIKKSLSLLLTFLLMFNQLVFAQSTKKTNVAILDFGGRGISKIESGTLTDRLRSELVKTGVFSVIDRGKMESILNEIGFQQTGCTSAECAVEAGRILNVQKMVSGNIGKLGKTYTIDVSLIDVQSGKIEQSYNRNYRGEIDGLLTQLKELAGEISGRSSPAPAKQQTGQQTEKKPVQTAGREIITEKKSSKTWLWITGGVLLAGGVVAAILLSGDKGDKDDSLPDPGPIWPPSSR